MVSQVVASGLLIFGAVLFAQWQRHTPSPQATFMELQPSLYRLNFNWELYIVAPVPVAVWLVESSPNSWVLIDGGTPNLKNQQAILQGLQTTLSSAEDTLRLVLGQTAVCFGLTAVAKYTMLYGAEISACCQTACADTAQAPSQALISPLPLPCMQLRMGIQITLGSWAKYWMLTQTSK